MSSYDPYEHREITSKSISNFEAFIHLVKCSFGIGVLSLPYAICRAGYLVSIVLGLPLVFIIIYAVHVLIRTMVKVSAIEQQPYTSFEKTTQIVVQNGPKNLAKTATCGRIFVGIMLVVYPIGIGTAYVLYMSHSLSEIYTLVDPHYSIYLYQVILLLPLFLMNCIPNLHKMVVFSAIADVLTLTCFVALFYYIFGEEPHISGAHELIGHNPLHIPLIIGPILFALEAISVILSLEERMKKPRSFLGYFGVYNASMAVVLLFYCLVGVAGYLKYGDQLMPSITSNLPHNWVSYSFRILFIIIIFFSYPIQCYPVIVILWERNLGNLVATKKKKVFYEYLFRFCLTLYTVILAAIIPKFEVVITLVGAVCISTLGLFLPAYIEFLYTWKLQEGKYNMTMIKDLSMMLIGILILIIVVVCTLTDEIYIMVHPLDNNRLIQHYDNASMYGL